LHENHNVAALAISAVSAMTTKDVHCKTLIKEKVPEVLVQVMMRTIPDENTNKYKPKLSSEELHQMLANPQEFLSSKQEQSKQPPPPTDPETERETIKYFNREKLRRNLIITLRNLCQPSETKLEIGNTLHLIPSLLNILFNPYENGLVVYYAISSLRLLLWADEPYNRPIGGTNNESIGYQKITDLIANHPNGLISVIGTAVCSRVVRLPDGSALWVHVEAARAVARMVACCSDSVLGALIKGNCTRALCDGTFATNNTLLHHEMAVALHRIIFFQPPPDFVTLTTTEPLEVDVPSHWLLILKQCGGWVVKATVGHVILAVKTIKEAQNKTKTNQLEEQLELATDNSSLAIDIITKLVDVPSFARQYVEASVIPVLETAIPDLPHKTNVLEPLLEKFRQMIKPVASEGGDPQKETQTREIVETDSEDSKSGKVNEQNNTEADENKAIAPAWSWWNLFHFTHLFSRCNVL